MSEEVVEGASGHTTGRMGGRIEVVARVSGRRHWTVEQKLPSGVCRAVDSSVDADAVSLVIGVLPR